ncbi:ankyrin repeat-containing domain protein [Boeremia exigua]|uniref:ankyrin repeat-containing domain protein n=1 Tax=Boeremia exigua TaxID=749465 RepID=UPI001E8CD066|nr:ankyrin repeat-containing domain protein [Boeremia exigua]KAH6644841.1 ankyrin repeat-containing domain protein [Boeremia exigua]
MRLLYTTGDGSLEWTEDFARNKIPPYAILSHTWGAQEMTFDDLKDIENAQSKEGFRKIRFCAQQVKRDGLDYFWIDTCCINKANYTELSKAINSMFRWYQNAEKCYVFLSDVGNDTLEGDGESVFRQSRWFTRGWTLQELLAPRSVEFFSKEGARLGDKESLQHTLHEVTGIPIEALLGSDLSKFDIARRFSWAAKRQTTEEEDGAYCLFGIFDVHLPLIYGERKENALERLRSAADLKYNGRSHEREKRLSKICSWLSAPDQSINYREALKKRQAETGLWLLESAKFIEWKESAASQLWLYGIPGCGKTVLSSTIIEHLMQVCLDDTSAVIAYFFFDFNDKQKQNPELMLRSLFCQLLQPFVAIPNSVDAFFSSSDNGQRQPSLDMLLEATSQVMQQLTHVYIVLDALDECTQRQELMDMLETVAGWQLDNVHLLMTSRKERDIESSLEGYLKEEDIICLQGDLVDGDIRRYVQQRLSNDKTLAKWNKDAAVRQEIKVALMRGAHGMFRWAACQLDTVANCRNRAALRKSLATLPETLDETYDRILCAISRRDCDYAKRILQWLTFSTRPMLVDEIAEVVAIDVARDPAFDHDEVLEDPLEALNICSSLVTISTIQTRGLGHAEQVIALAHYSVQEYLVSDRIKQGPANQYRMHEAECHGVMMDGCLRYLLQLQRPLSEEAIHTLALARYAAESWSSHLGKTGEDTERLIQPAMDLMSTENPAYLTWIQLYDPDSPWLQPDLRKGRGSVAAPLYYAALLGLNAITKLLLDQGAKVNTQGGRYGNALHAASLKGHKQIVRMLLTAGADIDAQSEDYGNSLQAASYEGHELIVKMLLEERADVNARGGKYGNALQSASAAGHQAIVQLLLDKGADVNKQGGLYSNALNAAASESHEAIVELLIKNSADASRYDSQGKNVLHHATNSAYCSLSLVKVLLSQGVPADTADIENMTPLHYSVKFGHKSIVELLVDSGLPIDVGVYRKPRSRNTLDTDTPYRSSVPESESHVSCASAGLTPLHFAALTGDSVMTKFLLERGADPNALSGYNESPMHLTLRKTLNGPKYDDDWTKSYWRVESLSELSEFEEDDTDAIDADIARHRQGVLDAMLADARTSLMIRDYQHEYPLHCIEYGQFGSVQTLNKLVSRGANPFERNLKQQNALHLASRAGDHDAVAVLLSLGVEPALTDIEGLNALHHAARSGKVETITVLLETTVATRPILMLSKDAMGRNLLHHLLSTTSRVRHETIRLLLDKGVDGLELDASGNSPLACYLKRHQFEPNIDICQQLLSVKGSYLFVDRKGQNLGHLCTWSSNCSVRVLETLREHGVDLTQKDLQSRTVLHCAAIKGSLTKESLHYLLHVVGIEINAEDGSGRTALQLAAEMASKDYHPQIFDRGRWDRSRRLLSESGVSKAAYRAIES